MPSHLHQCICMLRFAWQDSSFHHRTLICQGFCEYFEKAKDEVLDSGNQSLAVIFEIAIENMAEFIDDHKDDETTDVDKLRSRIYSLESENRKLKMKLENITKVINS